MASELMQGHSFEEFLESMRVQFKEQLGDVYILTEDGDYKDKDVTAHIFGGVISLGEAVKIRNRQLVFTKGDTVYVIVLTTKEEDWERHQKLMGKVLDSFKFLKKVNRAQRG